MATKSDREYLLRDQYRDASNLNARIALHVRFGTNAYGWNRWVFDQFALSSQARILELGCGPARLWLQNLGRIPEGWDVTLSDFSYGMLQEARRNVQTGQRTFRFVVADAQAVPFKSEHFDALVANHMLYHVPDRGKALSEVWRTLKPGGRFCASSVGRSHLREIDELVRTFDLGRGPWGGHPTMSFTLENGVEQLAPWFATVTLRRFDDALVITEAEPLVAYVLSMAVGRAVVGQKRVEFTKHVERELSSRGAIRATIETGMFVASKDG